MWSVPCAVVSRADMVLGELFAFYFFFLSFFLFPSHCFSHQEFYSYLCNLSIIHLLIRICYFFVYGWPYAGIAKKGEKKKPQKSIRKKQ